MPEKLVIQGGRPLEGKVRISGAKNSVLKLIAGALLTAEPVTLSNVPDISDVEVMLEVIRAVGADFARNGDRLVIHTPEIKNYEAPYELVQKMRASFNVLGALLGRHGRARVSLPGGCSIGKRNVDLHVKGLRALGATVDIEHGYVNAWADELVGTEILLDTPSVGATENIMLASVLAKGSTIINNAAQEPEIVDLANFLNALGGDISGAGTNEIIINGVQPENLRGTAAYAVVPDRIEAATYLIAVAGTGGEVEIQNIVPVHVSSITHKLMDMGAEITMPTPNSLYIKSSGRLQAQNIVTQPYPGFPTDLQAPMMSLLAVCDGVSIIKETIYENRFKHAMELKRMGADIQVEGDVAVVTGTGKLSGAQVKAHDLRAGAAMVIAGMIARGTTEIYQLAHLDRGYEFLVEKLGKLGGRIERVPAEESPFVTEEV